VRPVPAAETAVLVGFDTGVPLGRNTGVDSCIVKSGIQYLYSGGYSISIGWLTASGMNTPETKSAGNVIGNVRVFVARKNIRNPPSPDVVYPWPLSLLSFS
jgi:hypothetical protein